MWQVSWRWACRHSIVLGRAGALALHGELPCQSCCQSHVLYCHALSCDVFQLTPCSNSKLCTKCLVISSLATWLSAAPVAGQKLRVS